MGRRVSSRTRSYERGSWHRYERSDRTLRTGLLALLLVTMFATNGTNLDDQCRATSDPHPGYLNCGCPAGELCPHWPSGRPVKALGLGHSIHSHQKGSTISCDVLWSVHRSFNSFFVRSWKERPRCESVFPQLVALTLGVIIVSLVSLRCFCVRQAEGCFPTHPIVPHITALLRPVMPRPYLVQKAARRPRARKARAASLQQVQQKHIF